MIPVASPDLSGNEEAYVVDAIRSSWISSQGAYLDRFEGEFAEFCETPHAISVSNGTAALHVALLALDLRPGDEVLVPSLTYIATANAVRYMGAEPVFVDVDPENWCLNPELLEAAITRRTKGIIAVHLYGHPADMDAINRIAAVHGLWVVEDAAEAHGASYRGRRVGGLARVGTFSFYGNKIITSGEGGALTLHDESLALRLRTLKGQGVDPARRYFFPVTGYNFRMTNVAAALLCAQLERFDALRSARERVYASYQELLDGLPGITFQPESPWADVAPWLFSVLVDPDVFGCSRDRLAEHLASAGIDSRPFFVPLDLLPPFRREARERGDELPVTHQLAQRGINLPTFPQMTTEEVESVVAAIRAASR